MALLLLIIDALMAVPIVNEIDELLKLKTPFQSSLASIVMETLYGDLTMSLVEYISNVNVSLISGMSSREAATGTVIERMEGENVTRPLEPIKSSEPIKNKKNKKIKVH